MSSKSTTHLVAGFAGGLTSSVCLQPLELLKTRFQESNNVPKSAILKQYRELKNISKLWRGTLPSALRTSVGTALYLTILNYSRSQLALMKNTSSSDMDSFSSSTLPKLSNFENLSTGSITRGVVGFITMPFTIIKIRFESSFYAYKSINEAIGSIYSENNNGIKNFFRGYTATLARDAPYAGLYVLFYENLKTIIPRLTISNNNDTHSPHLYSTSTSALVNSSSAFLSACFATTITAPFDTIKTRLQLASGSSLGFWSTTTAIVNNEGVKNLFNGLSLRLVRKGMSAGISWCIYEELIKLHLL